MSEIISVRVPKELKKRMDEFRKRINWSQEIRNFLEKRLKELQREKVLKEIDETLEHLPTIPKGTAVKYVREDRDSH